MLETCLTSEDLSHLSLDRCFEWIYTFQWMHHLDKEILWIDDAVWSTDLGCWDSSVWPAGQDLGEGSLLLILQVMNPLLSRCAYLLDHGAGEESQLLHLLLLSLIQFYSYSYLYIEDSRSATEVMRISECAGECMRVLSAILKPRRGAIVSPVIIGKTDDEVSDPSSDPWGRVTSEIIQNGCKILCSELVNKVNFFLSLL
jgi:hypothetical protein